MVDKEQRYDTLVGIYLFSRNYSMGGWMASNGETHGRKNEQKR